MRKLFLAAAATFALQGCTIQGLTSDYGKLNDSQKERIVALKTFADTDPEKIYTINGVELREELAKHPKALVYVFKNGCTSDYCKPLIVYTNYAKRTNTKLFLVMNGYANLNQSLEMPYEGPLFAIAADQYPSRFRSTYTRYFENEMQGKPREEKAGEFLGSLFFFTNGQLEKVTRDLPNG